MKRFPLFLTIAALAWPQSGQAGWWRTYGTEADERGYCVQITKDGNYIITGYTWVLLKVDTLGNTLWSRSYEGIGGNWVEQTSDGGYVVTTFSPSILRTNAQGDSLWTRNYNMYSHCVQPTPDGGYIVIGGAKGFDYNEKLILLKTDSDGDTLWTKSFFEPGNNMNVGCFIQNTLDSGFIITGFTGYLDTLGFGWTDVWLVKTDSQGNKVWGKLYGNNNFNEGYSVRQTNDSGYIVTGFSPEGLLLIKTDIQGDTLWTKRYGILSQGTGFSVQQTQDGCYVIAGVTETFMTSMNLGMAKLWLLKTNAEGDTLWTRIYYGSGFDVGRCVQQTKDSGYIVVGYTSSQGAGKADIYLLKTDSLGLLAISEERTLKERGNWRLSVSVGPEIILHYSNCADGFRVSVFDVSGRMVSNLSVCGTGEAKVGGLSTGVYFARLQTGNSGVTRKVVIVR